VIVISSSFVKTPNKNLETSKEKKKGRSLKLQRLLEKKIIKRKKEGKKESTRMRN